MTKPNAPLGGNGLSEAIGRELPYLRRYARALTGRQETGDRYAAATLEAILSDPSIVGDAGGNVKRNLFRVFHTIWASTGASVEAPGSRREAMAQKHLSRLTENTREALLLHTIEGFTQSEIAGIMDLTVSEVDSLLDIARDEVARSVAGKVLIIEDEAIIAMDIEAIVADMGHRVTGVARTHDAAVRLGASDAPDLILADIQLADDSSGIDAVRDLLGTVGEIPVIFITAFPERLLTGERPEPTFLISKPYSEEQVRSAVGQAMFFASTEGMEV